LVEEHFSSDEMSVVVGDAEVGKTFVSMPFDHLLFTGSTAVGRQVALAAAANLTPVTLELGGKSPAIFDASCDLDAAVASVAYGKLLNAGQTCIAPDYLMVPQGQGAAIAAKLAGAMARLYPRLGDNPDYTAIVSERHQRRLSDMVAEARESGADVTEVNPANEKLGWCDRKMAPVLVRNAGESLRLMREEIFGPIISALPFDTLDEAVRRGNDTPYGLGAGVFTKDVGKAHQLANRLRAGSVWVNTYHAIDPAVPFGGYKMSGYGREGGAEHLDEYLNTKGVWIRID
ncbi:MAG: aldehyde dehydrogenase family protein, partial [Mesorhizobium sp.]